MRAYPSFVAGLRYRDPENGQRRDVYAARHVRAGDIVMLEPEPDNPHDPDAVAIRHDGFHLGYVPQRHDWMAEALDEGDVLRAVVDEVATAGWWFFKVARDVRLTVTVVSDG